MDVNLHIGGYNNYLVKKKFYSNNFVGGFTKSGPVICGKKTYYWDRKQCHSLNSTLQFEFEMVGDIVLKDSSTSSEL